MQGQLMRVDEAASVLGDRSDDRLVFSAWVEDAPDPADVQEVPIDAIEELGEAFSEDLDDAFADTVAQQSGDALEDVFVDALNAEDAGNYFARVLRGVQSAARSPARPGIPPDLLRRFAGLLRRYRAQRFDEMQAAEDLADRFSEEGTDEAASLVGGLLARALARPPARRPIPTLTRPLRQQLVRNTRQAAQMLVRRQGPAAIRTLPPIARSIQRTAIRQRTPVRALPSAIRNVTNRVAQTPALAQSLSRSRPLAGTLVPTATPRVLTYTTRDVIDKRISVPAQHALVRLSKNPTTSADAVGILEEIKAGRLAGIYKVDEGPPAQRAQRLDRSLGWGSLIPRGEGSALILDPDNLFRGLPMIVFHPNLAPASKGAELDAAVIRGWQAYLTFRSESISGVICCMNLGTPEVLDRFEFDKDTLQPFHQTQIARMAQCIVSREKSTLSVRSIRLVGHTDPVGTDEYNLQLGLRRTKNVERHLRQAIESLQAGLTNVIRFETTSLGESKPTGKGADRDRRVEVFLGLEGTLPSCPCPPTKSPNFTAWLQRSLNQILRVRLPISGIFDSQTRNALRNFQQSRGLIPTGSVNRETQVVLFQASPTRPPCDPENPQCFTSKLCDEKLWCSPSCSARDRINNPFYQDEFAIESTGIDQTKNRYRPETACLACNNPLTKERHNNPAYYNTISPYRIFASNAVRNNPKLINKSQKAKVTILFAVGDQMNRHGLRSFFSHSDDSVLIEVPGIEGERPNWGIGISDCQIAEMFAARKLKMDWELQILACYSTGYRGLLGTVSEQAVDLTSIRKVIFYDCFYDGTDTQITTRNALERIRDETQKNGNTLQVVIYDVTMGGTPNRNAILTPGMSRIVIDLKSHRRNQEPILWRSTMLRDLVYTRMFSEGLAAAPALVKSSEIPGPYRDLIPLLPPRGTLLSMAYASEPPPPTQQSLPLNKKGATSIITPSLAEWAITPQVMSLRRQVGPYQEQVRDLIWRRCLMGWRPPSANNVEDRALHDQFIPEFGWESMLAD